MSFKNAAFASSSCQDRIMLVIYKEGSGQENTSLVSKDPSLPWEAFISKMEIVT
jgi:hypothetical protein